MSGVISHSCGVAMYMGLVLAYAVQALVVWATQPIMETYSAADVRQFGTMDLDFEVTCPSCVSASRLGAWGASGVAFDSENLTNGTELYRVWYGYSSEDYPHCAAEGAQEDAFVADLPVKAKLCYSSDDIMERSGIQVYLWNMTVGGPFNRANIRATGPGLVVNTPMEWWHEKTLLIGMTVVRDQQERRVPTSFEAFLLRGLHLGIRLRPETRALPHQHAVRRPCARFSREPVERKALAHGTRVHPGSGHNPLGCAR